MTRISNLRRHAAQIAADLRDSRGKPHRWRRATARVDLERTLDLISEERPDIQAWQLRGMAAAARHAGRLDSARFLLNSARRYRQGA